MKSVFIFLGRTLPLFWLLSFSALAVASGRVEPLEESLAQSLEDLTHKFDWFRASAERPGSPETLSERSAAFQAYLLGLHAYGLVPAEESACLATLMPPFGEEQPTANLHLLREAEYRLQLTDPCYPVRAEARPRGPRGWDPEGRGNQEDDRNGRIYRGGDGGGVGRTGR